MTYTKGQQITYSNGSPAVYTGIIVAINNHGKELVIVDDQASMELHKAGFKVGACISPSQVINNLPVS